MFTPCARSRCAKMTRMTFDPNARLDSTRANTTSGGGRRGGTIAAGGGIGTLVIVGLFLLLGGNPSDIGQILGGSESSQSDGGSTDAFENCTTGEDANNNTDCRMLFTINSIDDVWGTILPEQANLEYTQPGLHLFSGAVSTACGNATSASGPFYCPGDESVYLDTSFFAELEKYGAADAPLAEEYIIAHEVGHHIQQIEGTLSLSNYNQPGEDSNAVKIETQADCYGGIWAHYADDGVSDQNLTSITEEQLYTAITAARAVGDDNIQERAGQEVRPDTFTHGSSEERAKAFMAGYETGKMSACDFLGRGAYNS